GPAWRGAPGSGPRLLRGLLLRPADPMGPVGRAAGRLARADRRRLRRLPLPGRAVPPALGGGGAALGSARAAPAGDDPRGSRGDAAPQPPAVGRLRAAGPRVYRQRPAPVLPHRARAAHRDPAQPPAYRPAVERRVDGDALRFLRRGRVLLPPAGGAAVQLL